MRNITRFAAVAASGAFLTLGMVTAASANTLPTGPPTGFPTGHPTGQPTQPTCPPGQVIVNGKCQKIQLPPPPVKPDPTPTYTHTQTPPPPLGNQGNNDNKNKCSTDDFFFNFPGHYTAPFEQAWNYNNHGNCQPTPTPVKRCQVVANDSWRGILTTYDNVTVGEHLTLGGRSYLVTNVHNGHPTTFKVNPALSPFDRGHSETFSCQLPKHGNPQLHPVI